MNLFKQIREELKLRVKSVINRHSNVGSFNSPTYTLDPQHPNYQIVKYPMEFLSALAKDYKINKAQARIEVLERGIRYFEDKLARLKFCKNYWENHPHNKGIVENIPSKYVTRYVWLIKNVNKTIDDAKEAIEECNTLLNN